MIRKILDRMSGAKRQRETAKQSREVLEKEQVLFAQVQEQNETQAIFDEKARTIREKLKKLADGNGQMGVQPKGGES